MTDQPTDLRRLTDLSSDEFTALLEVLFDQGYVDAEDFITPLGEEYIAAVLDDGTTRSELPLPPPPIAPNRIDPSGGMEWSDIADF